MTQKKDIGKILRQFGLVFVALFIIVFMSIKSDVFLTSQNIINILRQISINGILAVGMTFVILTGGIDLSVGSVVAITGVIVGSLLQSGTNWFLASLAALVISAICGVFNGWLISYVGFQPFIATLSTMTIGRGFAQVYSNGKPYTISDPSFIGNLTNAAVTYQSDVLEDMELGRGNLTSLHLKETLPGRFREVPYGTGHVDFEAAISKAWDLGVRRFVTEFWYTGNENWKADLNSAAGMAKPILEKMN